jgi:GIY-YIG catalytic domain
MTEIGFVRPEFQEWAKSTQELGFTDFITSEDGFVTELLSGTKWEMLSSSGIYAWITENGHSYVGQTVNIKGRLRQHWRIYRDIAYVAFQRVDVTLLDQEERALIKKMEERYPTSTLNIKFAASSARIVPFDEVIAPAATTFFLKGSTHEHSQIWKRWPLLENKQSRKFARFKVDEHFTQSIEALQIFLTRCVPNPPETEIKFWSATLLFPKQLLLRLNVGQQEVFTLHVHQKSVIATIFAISRLDDSAEAFPYQSNSYAHTVFADDLEVWLTKVRIVEIRKLVVWLMRHTVALNSGSHCPQLVR